MGQKGARKLDTIKSVTPGDVHIVMIPSPGGPVPTPLPHPVPNSIIKDKVAKKVKVMGQAGAVKGSISKHTPPHIPQGGPFQKQPANKGEIVTASSNVFYEGKEAAMFGDTAKMCADPTDAPVGLVVGNADSVLVGGGGSGSDEARAGAAAAAMKAAAADAHKWIDANMPPGADREQAHRDVCTATGHPIDVATGKLFTKNIDLKLPGRIPLEFTRNYSSARSDIGPFGHSWRHSYEAQLIVHCDFVAHRDENGRFLEFTPIKVGETAENLLGKLTLERRHNGYAVRDLGGTTQFFPYVGQPGKSASILPLDLIEDRFGNRVRLTYVDARLVQIRDTAGRVVSLSYNERGLISALRCGEADSEMLETIRTYRYSEDDDLIEWRDELNHAYRFEYHNKFLVKETDRAGFSFFFVYDRDGWCTETWGDGGIFYRRMEYDREKQRTRAIDSLGYSKLYEWNDKGTVEVESDHNGHTWTYEYNDALQRVRIEDPVGNIWRSEFDDQGRLVGTETPEGVSTSAEWDPEHRWMQYDDVYGQKWRKEFEDCGRITRTIDPLGRIRTEKRNQVGNLVQILHENGTETNCTYDLQGNLHRISLPTGLQVVREYSNRGDLLSESDQFGPRLRIEYDARGDRTRVWERNSGETKFEYDPERRIIRIIDPKGHDTEYIYGQFDRVLQIREPSVTLHDGSVIRPRRRFQYDPENRLVALVLAGGETTRFHYEGRSRPMRIEYPDGRVQRFERNGRDFILKFYENDTLVFEQDLDSDGRVVRRTTGDGEVFTYEYDAAGNPVSGELVGTSGGVYLEYDNLGRLVSEEGDYGRRVVEYRQGTDQMSYRWNGDLDLDLRWSQAPSGTMWEAVYRGNPAIRLEFDERDRLTRAMYGTGERHELNYEFRDKPISRTISTPTGSQTREDYEYDEEGWLVSCFVDSSTVYEYRRDSKNRLIGLIERSNGSSRDLSWGYDSSGNRVQSMAKSGESQHNEYRAGNQITKSGDNRFLYDDRGRVTSITNPQDGALRLEWDALGRLKAAHLPDGDSVSMRYDAFGRRIEKTSARGTTRFGWAGNRLVHEIRNDGEERHYLYRETTHRPLACFIRKTSEDWRFHSFTTDSRGAPIRLTGEGHEVVWEETLSPWGESSCSNDFDQPLALPGQYHDVETGLNYNFARYYMAGAGCYLSPDPIGIQGGDNLYAYVPDPVCWADPLGLSGDDGGCGGSGGQTETYYRTMSKKDFEELQRTGAVPATSETFISPTRSFSEDYEGVTVEFQMKPGTTKKLVEIGVRDTSNQTKGTHPDMPVVSSGWKSKNAFFKGEGKQTNIGLGNGKALDTFNNNIESFKPMSEQ